jgi:hypothetical protein
MLLAALITVLSQFCRADSTPAAGLTQDRLVRAYAHLKNADQMLTNAVLTSDDDLQTKAKAMTSDALKKEILALADRCLAEHSSAHREQRSEAFGYIKNAELRLFYDREEPQGGHTAYAQGQPTKAASESRLFLSRIKDALK